MACSTQTYICSSKFLKSCAKARLFFSAGLNSLETEGRYVLGFRFVFRVRIACTRVLASLFKTIRRICRSDCAAFERIFVIIPEIRVFACEARESCLPGRGARGRYQWFPPSDFLPFPKIIWCKPETGDRCEKGERQRIFSFVSFSNYSQCQIPCCYTGGFISAGAAQGELPARAREGPLGDDRDAQLVGLVATDGTCEFRCLISFILAGAVYHNTLTICATRLCRACTDSPTCVAVHYPILRKGKIKGRT